MARSAPIEVVKYSTVLVFLLKSRSIVIIQGQNQHGLGYYKTRPSAKYFGRKFQVI